MKMVLLTAIIVSFNSGKFLDECIKWVYKTVDFPFQLIIVDNNSKDNSVEVIKKYQKKHKNLKLIINPKNEGFSKANNRAINISKGRYILLLNSDVFLKSNYVKELINFLEDNKAYSSVQGKLILDSKRNIVDSVGNVLTKSGFAFNENHGCSNHKIESHEIFGVCAAAAVYRKSALEDVKINDEYFDNDFFAYLEDVDLDWRLRLKGYKAYFTNKAVAYHVREATTNPKYRIRQALRNRFFMVLKNDSTIKMILNLLFYTPVLLILPNRIKNLRLISKMLKKRKIIQKEKKVNKVPMEHTPYRKMLNILKLVRRS